MEIDQSEISGANTSLIDDRVRKRIHSIYPGLTTSSLDSLAQQIQKLLEAFGQRNSVSDRALWSEKDIVLITYADQVKDGQDPTLVTLRKFLEGFSIAEVINVVHLLPFYPYSSDDGFSVIDYCDLAPGIGSWKDVEQLNQSVDLMFDLVLNHCSRHNVWFKKFLLGDSDYINFFHVVDPDEDLSQVTRPRSLPLLTPFETTEGTKYVWTTFSDDQVDLNFSEPAVLVEFIRILLFYIEQGARIIRLDAVAFLWKIIGTSCIHLEETHEVIKLFRDLLDRVAPHVILLTETNVPHKENVSYFGDGDEAHMVYQFSLPPLVLDTFIHQDASPLRDWLENLDPPPTGTTFFNFGASHDGIGVRPLEGLLAPERFESLVSEVKNRGGFVSTRRKPDGTDSPYELNISYFDAIVGNENMEPGLKARKFLAAQSILLSLPGIPGIYFHSLVGTPNDSEAAETSGIPRRINRRKYGFEELTTILNDHSSVQAQLFESYLELIRVRTNCAAFHPQADIELWSSERINQHADDRLLIFERTTTDKSVSVLVAINPTANPVSLKLPIEQTYRNLVNQDDSISSQITIDSFDFCWLLNTTPLLPSET